MKEKKHIDRIFQEKLKNFEATPNDAVWKRINAELHDVDSNRKVIPVWWKIVGIAASLLLMFTIGNLVFNSNLENSNDIPTEVVDAKNESNTSEENNKEGLNPQEENTSNELLNTNLIQDSQTAASKDGNTNKSNSKDVIVKTHSNNDGVFKKNAVANSNQLNNNKSQNEVNINDVINGTSNSDNTSLAETQQNLEDKTSDSKNKNIITNNKATIAKNEIAKNIPKQLTSKGNISNGIKDASISKSNIKDAVAATDVSKDIDEEGINNNNTDKVKSPIEEAMAVSEDGEDYDEKEKEVIDRWSVAANVSPVYYNTLGKGSSIHNQFNNNAKKGQLNMAYGVNASYAISDKLSVRSGIGKVNVGYNTNDVLVYNGIGTASPQPIAAPNGAVFRNIDLKEEAQGITVISGETLAFAKVPDVVAQNLKSTLNQEISFIEIPVELEYKVSAKKLGVSLIGGFSTMLLEKNEVYTELNEERTVLGEANNINNVSYSANVGVGLGIKISEKINLNFEPTFKYQIKTFNNTTGDFKPYIIGVNSGLKFKF